MKSPDRDTVFGPRSIRRSDQASRASRKRKSFFEPLEPRQMMTIYPVEGTPFWDFAGNYYPETTFQTAPMEGFLSGNASGTPLQNAQNYLSQNKAAYGLSAADLTHYNVTDQYTDDDTGITHIYIQQNYAGLPIADAVGSIHITATGQVVAASANFVHGLTYPAANSTLTPEISAEDALNNYASTYSSTTSLSIDNGTTLSVEATGRNQKTIFTNPSLSADPIPVELHFVPSPEGGVELSWRIIARPPSGDNWFDASVAASGIRTGSITRIGDWSKNASYNVFPAPVQDPNYGARAVVVDPHSIVASPFGWHDSNGTPAPDFSDTRGNNVWAQDDLNGDDLGGLAAQGGAGLNFNSPLNITQAPLTYTAAAVTNLFYWTNLGHDVAELHGFTEPAGNFQMTNYSGRGIAGDQLFADAQDDGGIPVALGGQRNNANMFTPPDGQSGRIQMFLFDTRLNPLPPPIVAINPNRDGDLDGFIISHEFAHGISDRLTGGAANSNALLALQSGGMAEGWSDWFGLVMTSRPTDTATTPRFTGNWVNNENGTTGPGHRRFPYSFDMTVDPRTLNLFNGDSFPQQNFSEVHNAGEIWCSALWDMTQLLIQKYGRSTDLFTHSGGQNVALDTVVLGMKLQPANPTFLQARDAIISADRMLSGGQNYAEIWTAFARRGFGRSASDGRNANSLVVSATFDTPSIPISVSGTVFNDADGDGVRDVGEAAQAGWTIFNDANNNGVLDGTEPRTVSSAAGTYSFTFFSGQTLRLREVVQPNFSVTAPPGGVHVFTVTAGFTYSSVDFGNRLLGGRISGVKFNDLDGSGVQDPGEPGIEGIMIYCDLNNDGKISILEPAAMTDRFGRYTIQDVRPGTYTVREVFQPGMAQTFPDPLGTAGGAHLSVAVAANQTTANIHFGNQVAIDFGDAPTAAQSGLAASYPVTLAQNGARHGVLPGFGLGAGSGTGFTLVDAEADGQPTANADGDGADDNGVVMSSLTPGFPGTVSVTVSLGGFSAGVLQGWIDWNRDGDWNDAGEQVITDRATGAGTSNIQFNVPGNVSLGTTFARFRYGYERGIGPTGAALAGEVEDYQVTILANTPVANNDNFGARFGNQLVKQGSANNRLDVLANDFGISTGNPPVAVPPTLNLTTLPTTTTRGGTLAVQFDATLGRDVILYTPGATTTGLDTFQYQVSAGGLDSNFATVTIDVTASDPKAVDDVRFVQVVTNAAATPQRLPAPNLTANDLSPDAVNTRITAITKLTTDQAAATAVATISSDGQSIDFRPPTNFVGTIIYQYTIDDLDPNTSASSAKVTIQVVNNPADPTADAAIYTAQFGVNILDTTGAPISMVEAGEDFLVRIFTEDVRTGGAFFERGVLAAYMDLLFDPALAAPVASTTNPLGFDITFEVDPNATPGADAVTGPSSTPPAPAPTATSFSGSQALSNQDGAFDNVYIQFTSGPLSGQIGQVISYVGATRTFNFAAGDFTGAPAVGNTFTIRTPLYSFQQSGTPNKPAAGSIDEVGGTYLQPSASQPAPGKGPVQAFTIRMHAIAPGSLIVQPDPADSDANPDDRVVVLIGSIPATIPDIVPDEKVFLKPDSVTIVGAGEGEFTNFHNVLDVSGDGKISPIDALLIVNDINAYGSRSLSQLSLATSGALPPNHYLDVNFDQNVSPVDALLIFNHLNSLLASSGVGGEGEGEGEGEGSSALATLFTTDADADVPVNSIPESDSNILQTTVAPVAADAPAPQSAPAGESRLTRRLRELQESATDEVFSQLGIVRSLRSRFGRR